jgi:hypothetical protein
VKSLTHPKKEALPSQKKTLPHNVFMTGIGMIIEAYNLRPTTEKIAFWLMLLNDVPEKDFSLAVTKIVRSLPMLPGPADQVNIAALILQNVKEITTISAEEDWAEVTRNLIDMGSYGYPKWSSDVLKKTVDTLGWKNICLTPDKDMGMLRAHFFRIYNSQMQRECVDKVSEFRINPETKKLLSGIGKPMESKKLKEGDL